METIIIERFRVNINIENAVCALREKYPNLKMIKTDDYIKLIIPKKSFSAKTIILSINNTMRENGIKVKKFVIETDNKPPTSILLYI